MSRYRRSRRGLSAWRRLMLGALGAVLWTGAAHANMGGQTMMNGGMMGGMMWVMVVIGLLVLVLLILATAALLKYLFRK